MVKYRGCLLVAGCLMVLLGQACFGQGNQSHSAVSKDNKLKAVAMDRTVTISEVLTRKELRKLTGHTAKVTAVAFSPDGKKLASGGHDHLIRIWEVATGKELHVLRGHAADIESL